MTTDLLSEITTDHPKRGLKTIITGSEGCGKTSTLAYFKDPIYIVTAGEQSLSTLQKSGAIPPTKSFPPVATLMMLLEMIRQLIKSPKKVETLVIDALDGIEALVKDHVIKEKFNGKVESFMDYGRGWPHVSDNWRYLLQLLDELADQGTHVVIIAHLEVKRFSDPDWPDYDRWQPAAHKSIWPLTGRWSDNIFMISYLQHVTDGERGNKSKARGTSERIVYCTPGPARVCKNRFNLDDMYSLGTSPEAAAKVLKKILSL